MHHALIWHGRRVCDARKPNCDECGLNGLCLSAWKGPKMNRIVNKVLDQLFIGIMIV